MGGQFDPCPESVDRARSTLLVEHAAELLTIAGPPGPFRGSAQGSLGIIEDGAVAAGPDGRIIAVGCTEAVRAKLPRDCDPVVVDAAGRVVMPGLVDCHTHAVFAGHRAGEFSARLAGADYLAILAQGGGILETVRATRAASTEALVERGRTFLREMLSHGTTTVEIKSGYGLSVAEELRLLDVVRLLAEDWPQTLVPTFLGAHAVPPAHHRHPEAYVSLIVDEMVPRAAAGRLARFCDVYCERGVFTVDQARRVLRAALSRGLGVKLHADQKNAMGASALAAQLRAVSADHLEHAGEAEIAALAQAGTIAVLLPGAAVMLMEEKQAPARRMIERGVPVALATDFNPGTSPILSMPLVIALACVRRLLTPAEALVAATRNAAYAVGMGWSVGSLEQGKRADFILLDASSHLEIPYWFGRNLVSTVVKDGRVVWRRLTRNG